MPHTRGQVSESAVEAPQPYFYVPLAQFYTGLRVLQVRTSLPPETLMPSIERIIHAREPELVLFADPWGKTIRPWMLR
jgi:hypothetical protein